MTVERRSYRYTVTELGTKEIKCRIQTESGRVIRASAVLKNLSCGGTQLQCSRPLELGQEYIISLETSYSCLTAAITVRWAVPMAGRVWSVGCVFSEELAIEVFDALARAGLLQRRRAERLHKKIDCKVNVQGVPNPVPAEIRNYSKGGICLRTEVLVAVGDKLRIDLDDARSPYFLRVQWCQQDNGHSILGAQFIVESDYVRLIETAELTAPA